MRTHTHRCCACCCGCCLQVVLRVLGTAAGAGISAALLTSPFLASCPPLLVLLLAVEAALLAPLVSASLHLRFAIALTLISSQVVVLCQVASGSGAVDGQARFIVARIIEVGGRHSGCVGG